jgi:cyclic-di-GMP-binding protein
MVIQATTLNAVQLQFTDSAGCKRWIESVPLTNLQLAQRALAEQLALVRQSDIAPGELLRVMETLRGPARYVQTELASKYTAKSLPLDGHEAAVWTRAVGLWQSFTEGYLACRDAHVRGDLALRNHGALIVMRCLDYTARAMFEHYRIYHEVPAVLWKNLHDLYVFAEQSGFANTSVADTFNRSEADSSCGAAYVKALLAELANPFALTGRQMVFVARWIENWAAQIPLAVRPLPPSAIPSLCVDLAGSAGLVFAEECTPVSSLRYIDLEQIGRTLRQTITLLKQGQSPASLNLGEDARQPGCENLLMLLYIQWCRAGTGRGEQRRSIEEKAQVCLGMHAAHFFVGGRRFRAPDTPLTHQEEHDVQLFGRVSESTERALASIQSSAVESWDLVNHSNTGFMCMLREHDAQLRIGHNQLVAVRRGPEKSFHVGLVQWLRVEETSGMYSGVRLFPGIAHALLARPTNFHAPSGVDGFERALLLPEITVPATPPTLILPTGWYQAGRFVDLYDEQKQQKQIAKLLRVIERGLDFDRCTVVLV